MIIDKKIMYKSRRGMLELDLILTSFIRQHMPAMSLLNKKKFLKFLEMEDVDLWKILQCLKGSSDNNALILKLINLPSISEKRKF
jgi:succinate dehydrogenase flavin-adding protein (antitoxin of CptAB toxin-antitoxin module)